MRQRKCPCSFDAIVLNGNHVRLSAEIAKQKYRANGEKIDKVLISMDAANPSNSLEAAIGACHEAILDAVLPLGQKVML